MFIILKTNYFQLWVLYKSDLRISILQGNNSELSEIYNLKSGKTTISSTLFIRRFKGTGMNYTLPSLHVGSLKHFADRLHRYRNWKIIILG